MDSGCVRLRCLPKDRRWTTRHRSNCKAAGSVLRDTNLLYDLVALQVLCACKESIVTVKEIQECLLQCGGQF